MTTKNLFLIFSILAFSIACSENEEIPEIEKNESINVMYNKEYIRDAKLEEQLDYVTFHMTQLVNEVVSRENNFGDLFDKTKNKDGNYGKVFFRDVIYSAAFDNKGGDISDDIEFSLNAFLGLDEEERGLYLEKIKDGDDTNPIFLLSSYNTETEKEIVIGFNLSSNNELEQIEGEVLEEDIFGSDSSKSTSLSAYKIGTDGCGNYYKNSSCSDVPPDFGGNGAEELIYSMNVKDKKESWLTSASVCMEGFSFKINSSSPTGLEREPLVTRFANESWGGAIGTSRRENYEISPIKNRHVGVWRTVDYSPDGTGDLYAYAIYEFDGWPAFRKSVDVRINGKYLGTFKFRSYNEAYSKEIFTTRPSNLVGTEWDGIPTSNRVTIENSTIGYTFNP